MSGADGARRSGRKVKPTEKAQTSSPEATRVEPPPPQVTVRPKPRSGSNGVSTSATATEEASTSAGTGKKGGNVGRGRPPGAKETAAKATMVPGPSTQPVVTMKRKALTSSLSNVLATASAPHRTTGIASGSTPIPRSGSQSRPPGAGDDPDEKIVQLPKPTKKTQRKSASSQSAETGAATPAPIIANPAVASQEHVAEPEAAAAPETAVGGGPEASANRSGMAEDRTGDPRSSSPLSPLRTGQGLSPVANPRASTPSPRGQRSPVAAMHSSAMRLDHIAPQTTDGETTGGSPFFTAMESAPEADLEEEEKKKKEAALLMDFHTSPILQTTALPPLPPVSQEPAAEAPAPMDIDHDPVVEPAPALPVAASASETVEVKADQVPATVVEPPAPAVAPPALPAAEEGAFKKEIGKPKKKRVIQESDDDEPMEDVLPAPAPAPAPPMPSDAATSAALLVETPATAPETSEAAPVKGKARRKSSAAAAAAPVVEEEQATVAAATAPLRKTPKTPKIPDSDDDEVAATLLAPKVPTASATPLPASEQVPAVDAAPAPPSTSATKSKAKGKGKGKGPSRRGSSGTPALPAPGAVGEDVEMPQAEPSVEPSVSSSGLKLKIKPLANREAKRSGHESAAAVELEVSRGAKRSGHQESKAADDAAAAEPALAAEEPLLAPPVKQKQPKRVKGWVYIPEVVNDEDAAMEPSGSALVDTLFPDNEESSRETAKEERRRNARVEYTPMSEPEEVPEDSSVKRKKKGSKKKSKEHAVDPEELAAIRREEEEAADNEAVSKLRFSNIDKGKRKAADMEEKAEESASSQSQDRPSKTPKTAATSQPLSKQGSSQNPKPASGATSGPKPKSFGRLGAALGGSSPAPSQSSTGTPVHRPGAPPKKPKPAGLAGLLGGPVVRQAAKPETSAPKQSKIQATLKQEKSKVKSREEEQAELDAWREQRKQERAARDAAPGLNLMESNRALHTVEIALRQKFYALMEADTKQCQAQGYPSSEWPFLPHYHTFGSLSKYFPHDDVTYDSDDYYDSDGIDARTLDLERIGPSAGPRVATALAHQAARKAELAAAKLASTSASAAPVAPEEVAGPVAEPKESAPLPPPAEAQPAVATSPKVHPSRLAMLNNPTPAPTIPGKDVW